MTRNDFIEKIHSFIKTPIDNVIAAWLKYAEEMARFYTEKIEESDEFDDFIKETAKRLTPEANLDDLYAAFNGVYQKYGTDITQLIYLQEYLHPNSFMGAAEFLDNGGDIERVGQMNADDLFENGKPFWEAGEFRSYLKLSLQILHDMAEKAADQAVARGLDDRVTDDYILKLDDLSENYVFDTQNQNTFNDFALHALRVHPELSGLELSDDGNTAFLSFRKPFQSMDDNETDGKLVYIASPYAGDVDANVEFARCACRYCIEQGNVPIAAHLLYPQILNDKDPEQRKVGLILGRHIIKACQEMWVCGDIISLGMTGEINEAGKLGIPTLRISAEQIHGLKDPLYGIMAKWHIDSPCKGQSGFLYRDGKPLTYLTRELAETGINDIRSLRLNRSPVTEFRSVMFQCNHAADNRIDLELLRELDMYPSFDPDHFTVIDCTYNNNGGGFMVSTIETHLHDIDKTVWINVNDDFVSITPMDYLWNEDGSYSFEKYDDIVLYESYLDSELPDNTAPWFPMIQTALEYHIGQEISNPIFNDGYSFSLHPAWLPESLRQKAEPEYLEWLKANDMKVQIAKGGEIVIEAGYPSDTQSQTGFKMA